MKKQLFFFAVMTLMSFSLNAAADSVRFPAQWKPVGRAVLSDNSTSGIKVKTEVKGGGFTGNVVVKPLLRYTFNAEIRGEGSVQLGFYGTYGWTYAPAISLNSEWRKLEFSYAPVSSNVTLSIYSTRKASTSFEVRNLKAVQEKSEELTDAELPGKLFLASEYPGSNGKKVKDAEAAGGFAMTGKQWYCLANCPVPANSRDLWFYFRMKKNGDAVLQVYLLRNPGLQRISGRVPFKGEAGKRMWLKIGPVKAACAMPEAVVSFSGNPKITVSLDKMVVSTNKNLNDAALETIQ